MLNDLDSRDVFSRVNGEAGFDFRGADSILNNCF